ncbi:MAG: hypothetical protein ABSB41_11110 [Anaerolineales bacterium]|jgi:hypothetical protein
MKLLDNLKKPLVAAILAGIVGIILGLIWAWVIQPVEWVNVPPDKLGSYYQEQYLRAAIDSYKVKPDAALAMQRYQGLGAIGPTLLAQIEANPGSQDAGSILNFANAVQPPASPSVTPTPGTVKPAVGSLPLKSYALIVVAILVIALVVYAAVKYLLPIFRRSPPSEQTPAMRARDLSSHTEMTDYAARGEEPPIAQFVTTYVLGDDLFDDSFSIDSPAGEFLGECGIGISETIGVGDPKKVTAFEVWLFDKNDIQTVTKVLMSAHAFNDPATYQRLEAKGEPFQVERGKQVVLETAALQLVATVSDMEYGQGAMPEESYFERLTLEIAVWPKPATATTPQQPE